MSDHTDPKGPHEPAGAGAGVLPPGYPTSWVADALLTEGTALRMRPILPSDAPLLARFHAGLSPETVHYRYFGAHPLLEGDELEHLSLLDYDSRMAFVGLVRNELIGVVRYDLLDGREAEVAFVVADALQGRGVGTLLLEHLTAYARERGIDHLVAEMLPDNAAMIRLVEDSGLPYTVVRGTDELRVLISTEETDDYLARRDERERTAVAASVARLLRPRTVAVVGASRRPGSVGNRIVRNLVSGGFTGAVYPVNPKARAVVGVPAYPSLGAVPAPVDLAVVAVPAQGVLEVTRDAAAAGVAGLVIVTSGFAELGAPGAALQSEVLELARAAGMRVVGPNCLGVANMADDIQMNATFSSSAPAPGPIGLLSQSGALGITLLEEASRAGLGISAFISAGNKLDISSNDMLCYWEKDPNTSVIALYLESFGNPRKFARIARRVGARKPIVALKAGRTAAGARGASSHTASAATPAVAVHTLLSTCGVIEVDRLEELLDTTSTLAHLPPAKGRRVALVGNSGGPLILAADACATSGLAVEELRPELAGELAGFLPPISGLTNPIDITADGTPEHLRAARAAACANDAIDAAVAVVTTVGPLANLADVTGALAAAAETTTKPIIACVLGASGPLASAAAPSGPGARVAVLPTPERAIAALGRACAYAAWRALPPPEVHAPLVPRASVRPLVDAVLASSPAGRWLDADEAMALVARCGIPVVETVRVHSAQDAARAATEIGSPVALKAAAGDLVHKSDAGGVALGLSGAEAAAAYTAMADRLGHSLAAVVQPMRAAGVETIVGMRADEAFGPLVMVGLGGTATSLLGDHAFAVPPLSADEAGALIRRLRAAPLLTGYRNSPPADVAALADILRRIGDLALSCPEIVELDLNPVSVLGEGAVVLDAKVRVGPRAEGPEPTMRLLRRAPAPKEGER